MCLFSHPGCGASACRPPSCFRLFGGMMHKGGIRVLQGFKGKEIGRTWAAGREFAGVLLLIGAFMTRSFRLPFCLESGGARVTEGRWWRPWCCSARRRLPEGCSSCGRLTRSMRLDSFPAVFGWEGDVTRSKEWRQSQCYSIKRLEGSGQGEKWSSSTGFGASFFMLSAAPSTSINRRLGLEGWRVWYENGIKFDRDEVGEEVGHMEEVEVEHGRRTKKKIKKKR